MTPQILMLPRSGLLHYRAHRVCCCSSRLALRWGETSAVSSGSPGRSSFPIVTPPLTMSVPTMAAADFCLVTEHVAMIGAVQRTANQANLAMNVLRNYVNFRLTCAVFDILAMKTNGPWLSTHTVMKNMNRAHLTTAIGMVHQRRHSTLRLCI